MLRRIKKVLFSPLIIISPLLILLFFIITAINFGQVSAPSKVKAQNNSLFGGGQNPINRIFEGLQHRFDSWFTGESPGQTGGSQLPHPQTTISPSPLPPNITLTPTPPTYLNLGDMIQLSAKFTSNCKIDAPPDQLHEPTDDRSSQCDWPVPENQAYYDNIPEECEGNWVKANITCLDGGGGCAGNSTLSACLVKKTDSATNNIRYYLYWILRFRNNRFAYMQQGEQFAKDLGVQNLMLGETGITETPFAGVFKANGTWYHKEGTCSENTAQACGTVWPYPNRALMGENEPSCSSHLNCTYSAGGYLDCDVSNPNHRNLRPFVVDSNAVQSQGNLEEIGVLIQLKPRNGCCGAETSDGCGATAEYGALASVPVSEAIELGTTVTPPDITSPVWCAAEQYYQKGPGGCAKEEPPSSLDAWLGAGCQFPKDYDDTCNDTDPNPDPNDPYWKQCPSAGNISPFDLCWGLYSPAPGQYAPAPNPEPTGYKCRYQVPAGNYLGYPNYSCNDPLHLPPDYRMCYSIYSRWPGSAGATLGVSEEKKSSFRREINFLPRSLFRQLQKQTRSLAVKIEKSFNRGISLLRQQSHSLVQNFKEKIKPSTIKAAATHSAPIRLWRSVPRNYRSYFCDDEGQAGNPRPLPSNIKDELQDLARENDLLAPIRANCRSWEKDGMYYNNDVYRVLKEGNPDVYILEYANPRNWAGNIFGPRDITDENWYLHDDDWYNLNDDEKITKGKEHRVINPWLDCGGDEYLYDMGNPEFRQWFAQRVVWALQQGEPGAAIDGLWIDNAGFSNQIRKVKTVHDCQTIIPRNPHTNASYTLEEQKQETIAMAREIRQAVDQAFPNGKSLNGKPILLVPNIGKTLVEDEWQLVEIYGAVMSEGKPWLSPSKVSRYSLEEWQEQVRIMNEARKRNLPWVYVGKPYEDYPDAPWPGESRLMFGYASFLLAGNENFYYRHNYGGFNNWPGYDIELGPPQEEYGLISGSNNLYGRRFANAWVIVNPGENSETITLEQNYRLFNDYSDNGGNDRQDWRGVINSSGELEIKGYEAEIIITNEELSITPAPTGGFPTSPPRSLTPTPLPPATGASNDVGVAWVGYIRKLNGCNQFIEENTLLGETGIRGRSGSTPPPLHQGFGNTETRLCNTTDGSRCVDANGPDVCRKAIRVETFETLHRTKEAPPPDNAFTVSCLIRETTGRELNCGTGSCGSQTCNSAANPSTLCGDGTYCCPDPSTGNICDADGNCVGISAKQCGSQFCCGDYVTNDTCDTATQCQGFNPDLDQCKRPVEGSCSAAGYAGCDASNPCLNLEDCEIEKKYCSFPLPAIGSYNTEDGTNSSYGRNCKVYEWTERENIYTVEYMSNAVTIDLEVKNLSNHPVPAREFNWDYFGGRDNFDPDNFDPDNLPPEIDPQSFLTVSVTLPNFLDYYDYEIIYNDSEKTNPNFDESLNPQLLKKVLPTQDDQAQGQERKLKWYFSPLPSYQNAKNGNWKFTIRLTVVPSLIDAAGNYHFQDYTIRSLSELDYFTNKLPSDDRLVNLQFTTSWGETQSVELLSFWIGKGVLSTTSPPCAYDTPCYTDPEALPFGWPNLGTVSQDWGGINDINLDPNVTWSNPYADIYGPRFAAEGKDGLYLQCNADSENPLWYHTGIDIIPRSSEAWSPAVFSTMAGYVIKVVDPGPDPLYPGRGAYIEIASTIDDDWQPNFITRYANLAPGSIRVREGEYVPRHKLLALMGDSGTPGYLHLHYTIREGNHLQSPYNADIPDNNVGLWHYQDADSAIDPPFKSDIEWSEIDDIAPPYEADSCADNPYHCYVGDPKNLVAPPAPEKVFGSCRGTNPPRFFCTIRRKDDELRSCYYSNP